MRCLCCNKILNEDEKELMWHKSCIKKFFNSTTLPNISLSTSEILRINSTGHTVAGVQKKLSLYISSNLKHRITYLNQECGYIVKPPVSEFKCIVESEHLVMTMADAINIKTVPHALLKYNNQYLYITKRIDRVLTKDGIKKLPMEDFAQLSGRLTENKYIGSYEKCAKVMNDYSYMSYADKAEFFKRIVFSFAVGNSDMHLKNFSLINKGNGYMLSDAYDLLPVNLIMKADDEETALTLNGKKRNLRRKDFLLLANKLEINPIAANKMINMIISKRDIFIDLIKDSLIDDAMKLEFISLIDERINRLK